MSFFNYEVTEVWFSDDQIRVKLKDGNTASLPIADFPRLAQATPEQLKQFEIVDGYALYWPELDEDLSIAGFFEHQKETADNKVAYA